VRIASCETAEIIRKILLRQTSHLRNLYTPHASGRYADRLANIPDLKPDDLGVSNLNVMLRLIRFFSGTGMPAEAGRISSPAIVDIAQPAVSILAMLLLERGKIEEQDTAPRPVGPGGRVRPSSAA
jgi:hypothetical protein